MKTKNIYLNVCMLIAIIQLVLYNNSFAQMYDTAMQKYLLVKTWKGSVNINYSGRNEASKFNNTSQSNVVLTNEMGGMVMMWPYPDATKRNKAHYTQQETYDWNTDCPTNISSSGQLDYGVLLGINVINRTYYLHCIWQEPIIANFRGCDGVASEQNTMFHPDMVDIEEYPIDLSSVTPVLKGNKTYTDDDGISVTADWYLTPDSGRSQITIDPIDANWLPENNSVITTKIQWDADDIPTQVKFTLYDISREPGTCLNSIERDKMLDMNFDADWANDNHYTITHNSETEVIAERTSLELSNELTVSIKCFDFGASAKLKAEVLINNIWKQAVAKDGYENFISIPIDKDNDKIADKWETDNEVYGLAPDSDEDQLPSNGEIGDAITLYEEYRGFFILSPDRKHSRTDPGKKEIFVIDMDGLFSVPAWIAASDIMAYRLDNTMVKGGEGGQESRIVDFNQEYAAGIHKYSVRLKKSSEIIKEGDMTVLGESFPGTSLHKPPKYWDNVIIYVDAINGLTNEVIRNLENGINVTDERLKEVTGLTREQFNRINELTKNTSVVSTIQEFFVNRTIIHEIGHSCAADHHEPTTTGNLSCPMKYKNAMDSYTYIKDFLMDLLEFISVSGDGETIISFGNSKFCRDPLYNCYIELRVRDD